MRAEITWLNCATLVLAPRMLSAAASVTAVASASSPAPAACAYAIAIASGISFGTACAASLLAAGAFVAAVFVA